MSTRIHLDPTGDLDAAKLLINYALVRRNILRDIMSLGGLTQDQSLLVLIDGSKIRVKINYDEEDILIYAPPATGSFTRITDMLIVYCYYGEQEPVTTSLKFNFLLGVGYEYAGLYRSFISDNHHEKDGTVGGEYKTSLIVNADTKYSFFVWDIRNNTFAADNKVFWTDENGKKNYLKQSDYPFTPPVGGDVLGPWKDHLVALKSQKVVNPLYKSHDVRCPYFSVAAPYPYKEIILYQAVPWYNGNGEIGGYLVEQSNKYIDAIVPPWEQDSQTLTLDGTASSVFVLFDTNGVPCAPTHDTWHFSQQWDFIETSLYTANFNGHVHNIFDEQYYFNGSQIWTRELTFNATLHPLGPTSWSFSKQLEFINAGRHGSSWPGKIDYFGYSKYDGDTATTAPSNKSQAGDCIKVSGSFTCVTNSHVIQIHTHRAYEQNTYAQCIRRSKMGNLDVTTRTPALENACRNLIAKVVESMYGATPQQWPDDNPFYLYMEPFAAQLTCEVYGTPMSSCYSLMEFVNSNRLALGRSSLQAEEWCMTTCQEQIDYFISSGFVGHQASDGTVIDADYIADNWPHTYTGYYITGYGGEVVSVGRPSTTEEQIVNGWMSSPAHKAVLTSSPWYFAGCACGTFPESTKSIILGSGTYDPVTGTYSTGNTTYEIPKNLRGKMKCYIMRFSLISADQADNV